MMTAPCEERHHVRLGNETVPIVLKRSSRKTLGIAVTPDTSVVVTAPADQSIDRILREVERKAAWIVRSRQEFQVFLPRTPPRRFVPGETHLYLGREYRLSVESGPEAVRRDGTRLIASMPKPARTGAVKAVIARWYRRMAETVFIERLEHCLALFAAEGIQKPALTIRRLEKRWGSMSSDGGRMLLNIRLIEADRDEIDYVIIHELCHSLHPHHGRQFLALLGRKLPDWRLRKLSLEQRFS